MSPFLIGLRTAIGSTMVGAAAVALLIIGADAHFRLEDDALSTIAQIGATLLVAYAVETSWFVKESKVRGRNRESWIGFVVGVGLSSVIGIMIAIAMIGQPSPSALATLGATWLLFSLVYLAILVALMPYLLYEWAHSVHTEDPNE